MKLEYIFLFLGLGVIIYYILSGKSEEALSDNKNFTVTTEKGMPKGKAYPAPKDVVAKKTRDLPVPEYESEKLRATKKEKKDFETFREGWLKRSYSPSEIRAKVLAQLKPNYSLKAGHLIGDKLRTASNKAEVIRLSKIGFAEAFDVTPKYGDTTWYIFAYKLWAIYSEEAKGTYSSSYAADLYMELFEDFVSGKISISDIHDVDVITGKWIPGTTKAPVRIPREVIERKAKYLPLPQNPKYYRIM